MTSALDLGGERVLVVGPHLDDLPASAAGVLLGASRPTALTVCAGWQDGPPGWWDERCGFESPEAASVARRAEDRAALAFSGAEPVHLDLVDGQYGRPAGDAERLEADLRERFAAFDRVYVCAGIGGHVDHLLARDAVARARTPAQRVWLYGDYGYNTTQDWGESSGMARLGLLPSDFRSVALPPAWVQRKAAMLAEYRSQAEAFGSVPDFLAPHLLAVEWYVELPADAAPVEPWARPYRAHTC